MATDPVHAIHPLQPIRICTQTSSKCCFLVFTCRIRVFAVPRKVFGALPPLPWHLLESIPANKLQLHAHRTRSRFAPGALTHTCRCPTGAGFPLEVESSLTYWRFTMTEESRALGTSRGIENGRRDLLAYLLCRGIGNLSKMDFTCLLH